MTMKDEDELKRKAIALLSHMAQGQGADGKAPWLVETLQKIADGIGRLEATNAQLAVLTAEHKKVAESVAKLGDTNHQLSALAADHKRLVDAVGALGAAIPKSPVDYKPPTYKRPLRKGETIDSLDLRNVRERSVVVARKQFTRSNLEALLGPNGKLSRAVFKTLPAWPDRRGQPAKAEELTDLEVATLAKGLRAEVSTVPGGAESRDAVIAAFLDRAGLDQTTRLLLTSPGVLDGEFLLVAQAGKPQIWETLTVVEAIFRQLKTTATGYFTKLVEVHGSERGWDPNAKQTLVDTLVTRYAPETRV